MNQSIWQRYFENKLTEKTQKEVDNKEIIIKFANELKKL